MITARDLQDLAAGALELSCGRMLLTRGGPPENAVPTSGAGYIRQMGNGELSIALFVEKSPPPSGDILSPKGKSGQLFSEEDYYLLEAVDFSGRNWTASRVRPHFTQLEGAGDRLVMAEATIRELSGHETLPTKPSGSDLAIWYRGSLEFPFNVAVEQVESAGERKLRQSIAIGGAEFSGCGCDFFVRQDGGYLCVSAASVEDEFPDSLEERINEALELLLARRLFWTALTKREGSRLSWRLTGAPTNESSGRMQLPVAFTSGVRHECDAALDLLERFLSRVATHHGDRRPLLSIAVRAALESSDSPLDAHALDLAVAVESILATEFKERENPGERFAAELAKARDAIEGLDISDEVKNRIVGRISSMGGWSAKGTLLALEEEGLVTTAEVRAWDNIRHKATHGAFIEQVDQDYIDDFGRLMTLFYRLIFHVVGYSGRYRDYGEIGWPWRNRG